MQVGLDPGGDNRHPHHTLELVIEGGSEDDHGIGIDLAANPVRSLIDLEQRHVHAAGNIDQYGTGPLHRHVVEKRVVDSCLGGLRCPTIAGSFAGTHHRLAHLAHHGPDIGKVEIDLAWFDHQVGYPGNTLVQHRIGHMEGVGKSGALIGKPEQILVRDHDQRINKALHFDDPGLGLGHTALTFEVKRLGDHADGQDATLARRPGDDRCGAGAGTTTHAGSDEDHVAVGKLAHHRLDAFLGGGTSDIRFGSGTKSLRNRAAKLDLPAGQRMGKRLAVGVGNQEIDPIKV